MEDTNLRAKRIVVAAIAMVIVGVLLFVTFAIGVTVGSYFPVVGQATPTPTSVAPPGWVCVYIPNPHSVGQPMTGAFSWQYEPYTTTKSWNVVNNSYCNNIPVPLQ